MTTPTRKNLKWTEEEKNRIRELIEQGLSNSKIAMIVAPEFQRTIASCETMTSYIKNGRRKKNVRHSA